MLMAAVGVILEAVHHYDFTAFQYFAWLYGNAMNILAANYGGNHGIITLENADYLCKALAQLFNVPYESFWSIHYHNINGQEQLITHDTVHVM